jgi:choline dehydrogenase-like flavoprotein
VHWGGWCLRFKPEDFQLYSRTGSGVDWPISYDDLESYYCRAEEYLSVGGDSAEDWGSPDAPMRRTKAYPLPPFDGVHRKPRWPRPSKNSV